MHSLETLRSSSPQTPRCRVAVLLLPLLLLCSAAPLFAADPYAKALDKRVADLESGLKQKERERAQGHQDAGKGRSAHGNRWWAVTVILVAALATRFEIQTLNRRSRQKAAGRNKTEDSPDTVLLEESSVRSFFEELREGPTASSDSAPPESAQCLAGARTSALSRLHDWAPSVATKLQAHFIQASRSNDGATRQQALLELSEQFRSLCYGCRAPELRPIWQLAFGLEALTRQLAREPSEVTASTLQTVAGGVDLLREICANGLKLDAARHPPARFLVVDDDAVSRFAVAASLKKVFHAPDLAPDAETGLTLAAKQAYNAIFLDVEMPGMDGFELCKRIRQTACNPETPVVFVTRHCDFDSRAKAALSGGQYLLGKPFLALEITVKALTLVWRSRHPHLETKPAQAHDDTTSIRCAPVAMSRCAKRAPAAVSPAQ